LDGTHQLLVYANHFNGLDKRIDTIKNYIEALLDTVNKVGLEINAEKTECMFISHHQNAGQNHSIKIVTTFFKNVVKFK